MAVCRSCGQDNPGIARFCLACGTPLTAVDPVRPEERRVVSVVFVDLADFTAQAERLDPEDVRALLAPYHETVRREIESFGGVVEKFSGDGVLSVFGAPRAYGDDAERAVRAALAVRDSVGALDGDDPDRRLRVRIAVTTGEALVVLGARPARGESMIAGDVANTAARLQLAAPVGGVLVGRETYAATRASFVYEPVPPVVARGKVEPVEAWLAVRPRLAAGERPLAGPFVGRERELGLLATLWSRTVDCAVPQLVTVLGSAGVGKTRLTVEFAGNVEQLGGTVVRGRSLPYRESSAYVALATQIKQVAGIFETDPVPAAKEKLGAAVEALVPEEERARVASHLAILLGLDDDHVDDRELLFSAVRAFVEGLARRAPTLLVFEDLHWADPSLLDLVELLASRVQSLPLLVLALSRPELLDARPAWGGGLVGYTAMPLEPLPPAEAARLAAALLGQHADGAGRTAYVAEAAAGNPLFIEQLAGAVSESPNGRPERLPTTVRGIVAARLDRLPAAERAALLDAAVIGKVFWRRLLERIATDPAALPEALDALERRDLVRREPTSSMEGDDELAFKHVLIRDVAYELLPLATRRRMHGRIATFLEEETAEVGEAATATARHWRDAGEHERAIEYFVAAADEAERGWAKQRTVALLREALELAAPGDEERRRELRRRLAVAQAAVYHVPDARLLGRGRPAGA